MTAVPIPHPPAALHESRGVAFQSPRKHQQLPHTARGATELDREQAAALLFGTRPHKDNSQNEHNAVGGWSRNLASMIGRANAEVVASTHLRGVSSKTSQEHMRRADEQEKMVNERLRRRIKELKSFRTKLMTHEATTVKELALLVEAREHVATFARRLERPQNKCVSRVQLRAQRPGEENIEDPPTKALDAHVTSIRQNISSLTDLVERADRLAEQIRRLIATLRADIAAKDAAIAVDMECLTFTGEDTSGPHTPVGAANDHLSATQMEQALLPGAAQGPYAVPKSTTYPDTWKHVSTFNAETARALCNESREARAKLLAECKKSVDSQKVLNHAVVESLTKKAGQTARFAKMIESEIRRVESEIETLDQQRLAAAAALQDKQRPLEVVRRRLEARRNRPSKELVRDDVELGLEREFESLVASVKVLADRHASIEKELQRLALARRQLYSDLELKQKSLELDRQCVDLEGMSIYTASSSRGETPAAATPRPQQNVVPLPSITPNRYGTPRTN